MKSSMNSGLSRNAKRRRALLTAKQLPYVYVTRQGVTRRSACHEHQVVDAVASVVLKSPGRNAAESNVSRQTRQQIVGHRVLCDLCLILPSDVCKNESLSFHHFADLDVQRTPKDWRRVNKSMKLSVLSTRIHTIWQFIQQRLIEFSSHKTSI